MKKTNIFHMFAVELIKIRRSRIFWILLIPAVMMWLPCALHAESAVRINEYGISPAQNYFIQGYMGMAWFMLPATLVICTVLLVQTERMGRGLLKCLSLPVGAGTLCLAKFLVVILLTMVQCVLSMAAYYGSALLASRLCGYDLILPLPYVCRTAALIYLAALPAAAVYWMCGILIQTPIFSVGLGLASIVPSVLMLNTDFWYLYPMDYPFYMLMTRYGEAAPEVFASRIQLFPLLPAALAFTILSLLTACLRYGAAERK